MVSKDVINPKIIVWLSVPLSHLYIILRQYLGLLLRDGRSKLTSYSTQPAFNYYMPAMETTEQFVQS